MKGLFLTAALGVVCVSAFAQGTVDFANQGVGFAVPVYDALGSPCRNTFLADLFWAPGVISDSSLLTPLNAPALFSFSAPGYFYGGTRTLPTTPNVPVTVQVRIWEVYWGPSWDSASTVWGAMIGESILFQVNLADPSGTPTPLTGLSGQPRPWQMYYNAPEPPRIPPTIYIYQSGGMWRIIWYGGKLYSSATVNGVYTPVAGATSPYTIPTTGGARMEFYRAGP